MFDLGQEVLRTDVSGMPVEWVDYQQASKYLALDLVIYSLGETLYRIHGGINALSGQRSFVDVSAIIATRGVHPDYGHRRKQYTPPLTNRALFRRDANLCLYCGLRFSICDLSRDHVRPLCLGGRDRWNNVVIVTFKSCLRLVIRRKMHRRCSSTRTVSIVLDNIKQQLVSDLHPQTDGSAAVKRKLATGRVLWRQKHFLYRRLSFLQLSRRILLGNNRRVKHNFSVLV